MTTHDDARDTVPPSTTFRFYLTGISVTTLGKRLSPALPKKNQEASYRVSITATTNHVTFAIAGASIRVPAVTSRPFTVSMAYLWFKPILKDPHEDGATVLFEFAPGSFTLNNLVMILPELSVEAGVSDAVAPPPPDPMTPLPSAHAAKMPVHDETNPIHATVGLPLVAEYVYIRKHGLQLTLANRYFVAEQEQVVQLLTKAISLLDPVGITRSDLEQLLDRKSGISHT